MIRVNVRVWVHHVQHDIVKCSFVDALFNIYELIPKL
jgi:hypothetical protein